MAEAAKASESTSGGGTLRCPRCGSSQLVKDYESGQVICSTCGCVVEEQSFDRKPPRTFDEEEKEKKSRSGPPMTETIHDRGLSTQIEYKNRDAKGKSLSPTTKSAKPITPRRK